jgi:hypothetical protein
MNFRDRSFFFFLDGVKTKMTRPIPKPPKPAEPYPPPEYRIYRPPIRNDELNNDDESNSNPNPIPNPKRNKIKGRSEKAKKFWTAPVITGVTMGGTLGLVVLALAIVKVGKLGI